jgi:inner membrane protein
MMAKTHALFAVPFGVLCLSNELIEPGGSLFFAGGLILGSLLPDVDEPNSFIGTRVPFVSVPANAMLGHRGCTHFVVLPVSVFILSLFLPSLWSATFFGLSIGWLSHILGDLFFGGGIKGVLYPLYRGRVFFTRLKVGGVIENVFLIGLFVFDLIWGRHYFLPEFGIGI